MSTLKYCAKADNKAKESEGRIIGFGKQQNESKETIVLEYGGKVKEIAAKGSGEESQSKETMEAGAQC